MLAWELQTGTASNLKAAEIVARKSTPYSYEDLTVAAIEVRTQCVYHEGFI